MKIFKVQRANSNSDDWKTLITTKDKAKASNSYKNSLIIYLTGKFRFMEDDVVVEQANAYSLFSPERQMVKVEI